MKRWIERPCTQCDGEGWIEVPDHFRQWRCDGEIIYRKETCEQCGGSGEEPEPEPSDEEPEDEQHPTNQGEN